MNNREANFPRRTNVNCCLYIFKIDTETEKFISAKDESRNFLSGNLLTDNLNTNIQ